MKHRVKLAAMTVLISVAGLVIAVLQVQRSTIRTIVVNVPTPIINQPPAPVAVPSTLPTQTPLLAATDAPAVEAAAPEGATQHTAQPGETLSSLANDLRAKDTNAYREAILDANPSLKANPDKLIAGKTYVIPSPTDVPANVPASATVEPTEATAAAVEAPKVAEPVAPVAKREVIAAAPIDPTKQLKYTASPGDTVTNMAGAFLGNTDQAHQDTIINANASLQADPDHVVAGKAYKIPAPDGLAAASTSASADAKPRPAVQPDADTIVAAASTRTLRYTARYGDTVTSMAIALLGSDTPATRAAIIDTNPSLKVDPNRVVAGETYSIPAPTAIVTP
ncbi:hypothetical protein BH10PLA1_BH10PLA1_05690 [soil metagenome]